MLIFDTAFRGEAVLQVGGHTSPPRVGFKQSSFGSETTIAWSPKAGDARPRPRPPSVKLPAGKGDGYATH
jgi:hypothetical protein